MRLPSWTGSIGLALPITVLLSSGSGQTKDLNGIRDRKEALGLEMSIMVCSSRRGSIFEDWLCGCLTEPQNRTELLRRVEEIIEVAHVLGCPAIIILTGNGQPHLSPETQRASVVAGLQPLARCALGERGRNCEEENTAEKSPLTTGLQYQYRGGHALDSQRGRSPQCQDAIRHLPSANQ